MLTELHRKGGCLCQPAREGKLRCPLIVRPTSEDVVTGNLFQVLKILNPRWWLPDFLNEALGVPAFGRQVFRSLRIEPWVNKPIYRGRGLSSTPLGSRLRVQRLPDQDPRSPRQG
jgi:hypothetical protein